MVYSFLVVIFYLLCHMSLPLPPPRSCERKMTRRVFKQGSLRLSERIHENTWIDRSLVTHPRRARVFGESCFMDVELCFASCGSRLD